jgi:L-ascorbate metabolism protein UlaG (beta-lactamase superfamily)
MDGGRDDPDPVPGRVGGGGPGPGARLGGRLGRFRVGAAAGLWSWALAAGGILCAAVPATAGAWWLGVSAAGALAAQEPERSAPPQAVELTWLSVTNWLLQAGDTRILLDGYLTRIDRGLVEADGSSLGTARTDTAELRRLLAPALPDLRADWVLVGHAHWDHAFDVPALATLTGARIAGARTVCHQAVALGVDRCTAVEGGEAFEAGPGVRVRVVRWHHSGAASSDVGRRLRAPLELRAPPRPDPATGGLRPGFLDDYPNGGGGRGYLVTVATETGPVTLFWSNSGNPETWGVPVPVDSAYFREAGVDLPHLEWAPPAGSTRDALADALREEGLAGVDLWIGFGGTDHVRQVVETIRPRTFIPHHWDDFWAGMDDGPGAAFDGDTLAPVLDPAGIRLVVPGAYYDRFRLGPDGSTSTSTST